MPSRKQDVVEYKGRTYVLVNPAVKKSIDKKTSAKKTAKKIAKQVVSGKKQAPKSATKKQTVVRKAPVSVKKQASAPKKQVSAPKKQASAPKKQVSAPKKQAPVSVKKQTSASKKQAPVSVKKQTSAPKKTEQKEQVPTTVEDLKKKKLNRASLKKFASRVEILEAIKECIEKKLICQRPELGGINKLSKQALLKCVEPYMIRLVYKSIIERRRQIADRQLTPEDQTLFDQFYSYPCKDIIDAIKRSKIGPITNMHGLKKHDLIFAILDTKKAPELSLHLPVRQKEVPQEFEEEEEEFEEEETQGEAEGPQEFEDEGEEFEEEEAQEGEEFEEEGEEFEEEGEDDSDYILKPVEEGMDVSE